MRAHRISTRHRAVELHKQGMSRKQISRALAVDNGVVFDWVKRYLAGQVKSRCRKSERKEYTTPKGGLEDEYLVANNIAKRHGWH